MIGILDTVRSWVLAVSLANAPGPQVAETACTGAWEPDTDAWHECLCSLETWRCTAQGWCSDPQDTPPLPPPDPRKYWRSAEIGACE